MIRTMQRRRLHNNDNSNEHAKNKTCWEHDEQKAKTYRVGQEIKHADAQTHASKHL